MGEEDIVRALAAVASLTLVAGIVGGLVYVSKTGGLRVAMVWEPLGSVVLSVVAVVQVCSGLVAWWRRREPLGAAVPKADQVDHAHRTLAALVLAQWREEISIRRLDDPAPLAVRWRLTELPVMDHIEQVFRPNRLAFLFGRGQRRFGGSSDRVGELAEEFWRLPRRRLVILGGPGMGKTTLAVLLIREVLRRYEPGQPVPVLVSMSDWHPAEESLQGWLARRLTEIYPALRSAVFGPDVAAAMVGQQRILPVLDGLDELSESVRPGVLTALNAAATTEDALILTCRTAAYEAAITDPGGASLIGGAVIEPHPPHPGDVSAYLMRCLRQRADDGWRQLLAALADRNGPVARALTTPLDLWLIRKVYIDTGADPRELLDARRFPTAGDITDHLLDHLVHAAFTVDPPHRDSDRPHSVRPRHHWDPDEAKRWLSFLAAHLHSTGSRDIAWWRLYHAAGRVRLVHRLVAGLVLGVVAGSAAGLAGGLTGAMSGQPRVGFTGGLVGGLVLGPIITLSTGLTAKPAHVNLRLRGRVRALMGKLNRPLALGAAIGLAVALVFAALARPEITSFTHVLAFGLSVGLGGGLIVGLMEWAPTPVPDDPAQTPVGTLRGDLRLLYGRTALAVLIGGLLFGLTIDLVKEQVIFFVLGFEGAVAVLLTLRLHRWTVTASSVYLCAVAILGIRGRTPRRLMSFLDDAHRVGLLRQVGPVHQFRHAKLQDRLASTHRQPT